MEKIQFDDIDQAILVQLSTDGRKSYADIATDLGLSAGTVRNRIKRLEDADVLKVIGVVNPNHLKLDAYGTIYLRISPPNLIDQVVAQLIALPELNFLVSVTGDYHLHADVLCADNEHFLRLLNDTIHKIEGVVDTQTTMVLHVHKYGMSHTSVLNTLIRQS